MYGLPKGVLSFAVRATIDCLPSPDNLMLWGKKLSDRCKLCGGKGTLLHILNWCPVALDQGRFTYRHNSVLSSILKSLKSGATSNNIQIQIFADLPGNTVNGGTIPASIIPTTEKPDICLYLPDKKKVILFELTVPFESNITQARQRKCDRYGSLVNDINMAGYSCSLICLEIGNRGVVTKENMSQLKNLFKFVGIRKCKDLSKSLSSIYLMCSYVIFNARNELVWTDLSLLQ